MNRAEIVDALAQQTNRSKADMEKFLTALISTVEKNIKKKEGVKLVGFGTFATARRQARTGRNPMTGETIQIPARTVAVFRAGQELKKYVYSLK